MTFMPSALCYGVFRGLKELITPLLAGLLESNTDKMLKFDEFFTIVQTICGKQMITVFYATTCTLVKIYMNKDEKYV
jgi:TANK-binding kinase 1